MSIESITAAALTAAQVPPALGSPGAPTASPVQAGYNVSLNDLGAFNRSLATAAQRVEARLPPQAAEAVKTLMRPFEHINTEAASLGRDARSAQAAGRELTPGEMVNLTVRCQEFMFHCQLTSNIANRTSDGLQQLFRQQS